MRHFPAANSLGAIGARFLCGAAAVAAGLAWVQALTGAGGNDAQAVLLTAALGLSVIACLSRVRDDGAPVAWLCLGIALAAFGYTAVKYATDSSVAGDFPSTADVGALGYGLAAIAFVLFARRELTGLPRALWLDAAIGALALAAVGDVIVHTGIAGGESPDNTATGQLVYLAADLMVAGFVLVAWGMAGFRRSPLVLLGFGAAAMAVCDAIYTVRIFDGMTEWPPLLAAAWTTSVVAMAAAALLDTRPDAARHLPRWSLVSVPVTATGIAIVIPLLHDDRKDISVYLSMAVLVLSVVRLAVSLVDNQRAEERRRREEEVRREREEAQRANLAKTQFLSRMSHEVRTPLNSILGFAQLLVDDVQGEDRASVDRILRAGNHLRKLLDDVLDLSAIEAGETVVSLEPVDLDPAIEESVALLEPLVRDRGLGIVRRDGEDAPGAVVADEQRLKQVLINLISNAIKYGGSDSEVVVQVDRRGDRARICVIDAGPGIPEEDLPQLFQPFERGRARGSNVEGSGLGLALTKNLVETMNGSIGVETGATGSTFWFTLPTADRVGAKQVTRQLDPVVGDSGESTHTALYIEDHASNITLVERLLSRRGDFELVTAMTGRAGLKLAATVLPDVVLLDLDLPDIRGEDVLAELRFDAATRDIPVIVVSADATARRQEELLREGAAAYVVKPIQLASFMATLDAVVAGRAPAG